MAQIHYQKGSYVIPRFKEGGKAGGGGIKKNKTKPKETVKRKT